MNLAPAVLAVLPALIFLTLGTAKIVALQPMRQRAAEVGFSTLAYRREQMQNSRTSDLIFSVPPAQPHARASAVVAEAHSRPTSVPTQTTP
jgi:hypothetical protein